MKKKTPLVRNLEFHTDSWGDLRVGQGISFVDVVNGQWLKETLDISHETGRTRKARFVNYSVLRPQDAGKALLLTIVGRLHGALIIDTTDEFDMKTARVRFCQTWREKLGLGVGKVRYLRVSLS
jgi:hypothetical protein